MKQQVFSAKRKKIISQTLGIWLCLLVQLIINIWLIPPALNDNKLLPLILGNLLLSIISIPGIIIFLRYYKHSINKEFIITYNSLKYVDILTQKETELKNHETIEIKLVTNSNGSRFPWNFLEYFSITDKSGKQIIITSFLMDISEFWLSTLTKKISSKNLRTENVIFPIFKQPKNDPISTSPHQHFP